MIARYPASILRIFKIRKVCPTVSPSDGKIEDSMRIIVNEQCALETVSGPDDVEFGRPIAIHDVCDVVDVYPVEDHTGSSYEVHSVEIACLAIVFEKCAVAPIG